MSSQNVGTIDVVFQLTAATTDYNCVQGVELTFGDDIVINSASGATIDGNTVLFGATIPDGGGAFCAGSHVLIVNINTPNGFNTSSSSTPFDVTWAAYDDNWAQLWCESNCETCEVYSIGNACDGTVLSVAANAEGTATISELSYSVTSEYHWNVRNLTTGQVIRENQTWIAGSDLYGGNSIEKASDPYVSYGNDESQVSSEGFQIYVNGGYEAPTDAFAREFTLNQAAAALYGDAIYDVDAYPDYGWSSTALCTDPDVLGYGVTDINILQRDIQIRWTGEYEDSISYTGASGESIWYMTCGKDENGDCIGGSYAWISGARNYDISTHPDPGNVNQDGTPFRLWIPFEVWDMEALDDAGNKIEGGQQIDIARTS